jgi:hypothetical protein
VRFENKNLFFYHEKCSSLLQRWRCSCEFKIRRIGSTEATNIKVLASSLHIWDRCY